MLIGHSEGVGVFLPILGGKHTENRLIPPIFRLNSGTIQHVFGINSAYLQAQHRQTSNFSVHSRHHFRKISVFFWNGDSKRWEAWKREVLDMESSRLPARLTAYVEAIDAARAAGVTWKQIAEVFGVEGKGKPKYFAAAVKIARQGKYKAQEQKPLPPIVTKSRSREEPRSQSAAAPEAKPAQTLEIPKKQDYRTGAEIISQASNFETLG